MHEPVAPRHSILIALLVAGTFFMENLDGTVIATALPQMAESFRTSPIDLNIGMTAYMLTLAVFIPISGWVADRFGSRNIFSTAIVIFTVSSILCGISRDLWEFTGARIVQGVGGAMMVPVGRLAVLRNTRKQDLMQAIAYITWPGLVAPILGPPVGGFITTYASWPWIFFLNVPLGFVGLILALRLIPNQRGDERTGFDWTGFLLSGVACSALMYSLELMGRQDVVWPEAISFLAGSVFLGSWAVWHSLRHPQPLISLHSLRIQTFAVTIWGGSLFRIAISVTPFLLPLMFQVGFGLSAYQSGLLVLAVFAGNLAMKPMTTPLIRRFGFKPVLIVNGLLTAALLVGCGLLSPATPRLLLLVVLFASGLSRSMQFTALITLGFSDIPAQWMSAATSFSSLVQQMTMGMGVAVGAIALRISAAWHGHPAHALQVADFQLAFYLVALLAVGAVADCFLLDRNAGAAVSGHRTSPSHGRALED